MTEIDWSKAPEGATHVELRRDGNVEWWFKQAATGALFHWVPDFDTHWCEEPDPLPVCAIAKPWTGEGLPPVGTVCYALVTGRTISCEIVAHFDGRAVGVMADKESVFLFEAKELSPIRTPEQIAAEDREKAIEEMWNVYWQPHAPTAKAALGLLYDAGYRKQAQP